MNQKNLTSSQKICVLFIGLKNDYGYPQRGYSFEYENFYKTLMNMEDVSVTIFPYDEIMREHGRDRMNDLLIDAVHKIRPDICFFFLFTDEIKKQTIQVLKNRVDTVVLNWFADDHWRFDEYSRYWAPFFNWVVSTDKESLEKYHKIGCNNVIMSQWGANHFIYKHFDVPLEYDVTFVGQVHSNRKRIIEKLKNCGIKVECWGNGWPNGRLSQENMIKLFSKSKINLNFTDSSAVLNVKQLAKIFLSRRTDNTLKMRRPMEMVAHTKTMLNSRRAQIKGRNFEIPVAGGFLLTEYVEGIEDYYTPDKEIAVFHNFNELENKIIYYLNNNDERESIRVAGKRRTLKDHTYENRFEKIFTMMGLFKLKLEQSSDHS